MVKGPHSEADFALTRREFLRGAGALGVMCAAGQPRITAEDSFGRKTGKNRTQEAQPAETGWHPRRPPLSTPWTGQVSPENCLVEYPRPQMKRKNWLNLNGIWQFALAAAGEEPPIQRNLNERILVPFPPESALSGIMRHEERMYYRRRFIVPKEWKLANREKGSQRRRLLLHFDAVDYQAKVWVNGSLVGMHEGGYDRFTLDITDALLGGDDDKPSYPQELVVGVYDPTEKGTQPLGKQRAGAIDNPHSVLYYVPTSGIWQTVWMEPVPVACIRQLDLTPDLANHSLRLSVHTVNAPHGTVEVTAYDGADPVAREIGRPDQQITLSIPQPKLWSPDSPFLYNLKIRLTELELEAVHASSASADGGAESAGDSSCADEVESYFGMRSIEVNNINGKPHIELNRTFIFQLSTLQQGFWPDGIYTAATDEALCFDLESAKALGFNTVRKHQKIEPDRWYYHADRLGLLVWQDMPATATGRQASRPKDAALHPGPDGEKQFEIELQRLIDQHKNHPSIVLWIPFNEGWGEFETSYIAGLVRKWDPTRLVDPMSGFNVCRCGFTGGDISDRHNLRTIWPGPPPDLSGDRAIIIGEFGAYGMSVMGHTWDPANAHPHIQVSDADELTKDYVNALNQIRDFAITSGLSGANYNLFEDVEHQVNGLFTYDRKILKPNRDQVREANVKVLESAALVNQGRSDAVSNKEEK